MMEDQKQTPEGQTSRDKHFKDCHTGCQAYTWGDWDGQRSAAICPNCTKRDAPRPETRAIEELHMMRLGGMPIERDELPADVWTIMGYLAKRDAPRLF
jgi:hypothetical protein